MRTISNRQLNQIAGGLLQSKMDEPKPYMIKGPGDGCPSYHPGGGNAETMDIAQWMLNGIDADFYGQIIEQSFFTMEFPESATESQVATTCSILEADCTTFQQTGNHIENFQGSMINPNFIDWSAYLSGGSTASQCITNLDSLLAGGQGLTLDSNYSCTLGEFSIDRSWVFGHENSTNSLVATVPNIGHSGITVAHGVDLGQMNYHDLQALGLSTTLTSLLTPYIGPHDRASAKALLASTPLTLTELQAKQLDFAVFSHARDLLATNFNRASDLSFTDLPANTQTAIFDLSYQYGANLAVSAPNFWSDITQGDWSAAYNELMNFGDAFSTRRHDEAAKLKQDIDSGAL